MDRAMQRIALEDVLRQAVFKRLHEICARYHCRKYLICTKNKKPFLKFTQNQVLWFENNWFKVCFHN